MFEFGSQRLSCAACNPSSASRNRSMAFCTSPRFSSDSFKSASRVTFGMTYSVGGVLKLTSFGARPSVLNKLNRASSRVFLAAIVPTLAFSSACWLLRSCSRVIWLLACCWLATFSRASLKPSLLLASSRSVTAMRAAKYWLLALTIRFLRASLRSKAARCKASSELRA